MARFLYTLRDTDAAPAATNVPAGETVGSVGAVGAAPVLSRDVVVAAVRI